MDGGSWIQLKQRRGDQYLFAIYNDFSGELELEAVFQASGKCEVISFQGDRIIDYIVAFDGESIHLDIQIQGRICILETV